MEKNNLNTESDIEFRKTEKIATDEIDIDQYLSDDEVPTYKLYSNNYHKQRRK